MRAKREFTLPSDAVQGPGTWVKFKRLTWAEVKPFIGKDVLDKVAAQITAWNWTDENGEPLPLPKTGEDVSNLLSEETVFLLNGAATFELSTDEAKN